MVTENYLNNAIRPWFKQSNTLTATTYYLGVSTSIINNDGTGITEPSVSSGYQRYAIPINATNWTNAVNGVVSNALAITMNEIIVDSGTAVYWFLSETSTGNAVIFDEFKSPRPLVANSTIYVNAGELKIGVQNLAA